VWSDGLIGRAPTLLSAVLGPLVDPGVAPAGAAMIAASASEERNTEETSKEVLELTRA